MRKAMWLCAVALLCLAFATGCSSMGGEAVPSPTVPAAPSPSAVAPSATTPAQAEVYQLVGEAAVINVGTAKVNGNAYYAGEAKNTMLFPLGEVAKALGWTVDEPDTAGNVEIKLTKEGGEEIVIAYAKPGANVAGNIAGVKVTKGGQPVDMGNEPMPYIDGKLYVTEGFLNKAVEEVTVNYDGALKITIEAKA